MENNSTQLVTFGFNPAAKALPFGREQSNLRLGALAAAGESSTKLRSTKFIKKAFPTDRGLNVLPVRRSKAVLPTGHFASMSLSLASITASAGPKTKRSFKEVMVYAGQKALSGGIPGMIAMALQVCTLMWLRTTINYQYRFGTTTMQAFQALWKEGGIPRFYSGMAPALIQGPLSRFGDTAANTGVLAFMENFDDVPVALQTVAASVSAALFRIVLMPVDALKTIMQVEGKNGIPALANKIKLGGPGVLFHGALAASTATFVGHYPWFFVYNNLNSMLPQYDDLPKRLSRSAFIGFCSSFVSDCCSNSIRVLKTAKQTSTVPVTYQEIVKTIVAKDGVVGLFGRGLQTKLVTNGIQGILFSVLWRLGQDYYNNKEAADKLAAATAAAPVKK
jgi:hypothetical protein